MSDTITPPDAAGPTLEGASGACYSLEAEPVAAGAQGVVWRATDAGGRVVAVKVAAAGRRAADALIHEGTLLADLAAAGVPCVGERLDTGTLDGRPALVLPWYPFHADAFVRERIASSGGIALEAVLEFFAELCRSLAALHRARIRVEGGTLAAVVHRDIKPENILVDHEGRIRLVDFGGALVVDRLEAVRMAVFGTPMWAPYDQVLPGLPEPNATWDTYAACVLLFWWLTDRRPEYQADPSPMLTERGRAAWDALCEVVTAPDADALRAAHSALAEVRSDTRERDLVDVRGHAALQRPDIDAIAAGVRRLADAGLHGDQALDNAAVALGDLLARGLSPLSHPSPPNRFWNADELANQVAVIRDGLTAARRARAGEQERAGLTREVARLRRERTPLAWTTMLGIVIGGALVLTAIGAAILGVSVVRRIPVPTPTGESVLVEAGPFPFGDTFGNGRDDERPVREVDLPAFRIGRTEVSHAEYRSCVDVGACEPPTMSDAIYEGLGEDEQPVVGITWEQGSAYCAWRGGRLPSEEEWEKAATWTGDLKRRWPWGADTPDCARANLGGCAGTTVASDSLPTGASAVGALQMAGNVWEWTSSPYVARRGLFRRESQRGYVLRGGAWNSTEESSRPTFRRHAPADQASEVHGVRCAWDED